MSWVTSVWGGIRGAYGAVTSDLPVGVATAIEVVAAVATVSVAIAAAPVIGAAVLGWGLTGLAATATTLAAGAIVSTAVYQTVKAIGTQVAVVSMQIHRSIVEDIPFAEAAQQLSDPAGAVTTNPATPGAVGGVGATPPDATPPAPLGGIRIGDPGLPESGTDAFGSYTRTKNGLRDYGDGTYGVGTRSFTKKGRETAESKARNASNPIALDLDGNGTVDLVDLSASTAFYDLNGDGYRTHLGWVGPADGFLAYDKNGDGIIQDGDELSFTTFVNAALGEAQALSLYDRNLDGVLTDLESLAHFDVNKDGALNPKRAVHFFSISSIL